jgi:hypothetical protein
MSLLLAAVSLVLERTAIANARSPQFHLSRAPFSLVLFHAVAAVEVKQDRSVDRGD